MLDFEERARFYKSSIYTTGVNFDVVCYVEDKDDVLGQIRNPHIFRFVRTR